MVAGILNVQKRRGGMDVRVGYNYHNVRVGGKGVDER